MAERLRLEYEVSVTGLEGVAAAASGASRSAEQASAALRGARVSASQTLPMLMMGVRALNATRLAVEQTAKAVTDLDPRAAVYAFLNMMQVVRNVTAVTRMLKESTGAASAAQAVLAALTGRWWLIPMAIAAGAMVYAYVKSMQRGGPVERTGLYLLHRGEYVVPGGTVQRFGPIFITFDRPPRGGLDADALIREFGAEIALRARRMGP